MKSQPTFCVNHGGTRAKRRCFQCLSSICPACQRRALGHIFCSRKCQLRFWFSERSETIRRYILRITLRYRRVERSLSRFTGGGFVRLFSITLLLVILYQSATIVKTAREIQAPGWGGQALPAFPTAELVHKGEWVTVAGAAPGFGVAVLLADGREQDVCIVKEGYYSFTFQADESTRSVQVQVYGDRMPTLYSRALPIPEDLLASEKALPETAPPREEPEAATVPETVAETTPAPPPPPEPTPKAAGKIEKPAASTLTDPAEDIVRGSSGSGVVAITFDGGSYSNAAARILELLKQRELKATFFLTGEFMANYPDITCRIADEGHEVGNHTYSHLHLTTFGKNFRQDTLPGITREVVLEELRKNETLFEKTTGHRMVRLWRAPYGEQNETIRRWASAEGYRHVSWTYDPKTRKSLDTLDWVSDQSSALYLSSEEIVEKIVSFDTQTEIGLDGGIVLLHLGSERRTDPFHRRLGDLIDRLKEKGYKVGSVGALLEKGG